MCLLTLSLVARDKDGSGQQPARLRVTTELVLVNVVVRDKKGNAISNLKKEDFTVFEDGQKQQISSFDFEECGRADDGRNGGADCDGCSRNDRFAFGPCGTDDTRGQRPAVDAAFF